MQQQEDLFADVKTKNEIKDGNNEQNKGSQGMDSQYDERREDKNGAAGEGEVRGQSSYQVDKTNTSERPDGRPEGNEGNAPISADNVPRRASEEQSADEGIEYEAEKANERAARMEKLTDEQLRNLIEAKETTAKDEDELYDDADYVAALNEVEGRAQELYEKVVGTSDEQIISALGGDEMLDAVKDAIEKLKKGESIGQIETGLLKAVALAKTEEATKAVKEVIDKANGEKPKKAVTNQDGTLSFGGKKYKIIVTNPPFGSTVTKEYDGYTISGLEHQMSINALESMEDDGRAAIIIGGRTEYAQNGAIKGRDKAFLSYLYQHYDVVDVINMSGKDLYSRQGTGYDTRMILINGRRTGEDVLKPHFPPVFSKARAELVKDYNELYKRIEDDILRNRDKSAGIHDGQGGKEGDRGDNRTDVAPVTKKGVRDVRVEGGSGEPELLVGGGQRIPLVGSTPHGTERVDGEGNSDGAGDVGMDDGVSALNGSGQQPTESDRGATDGSGRGQSELP